ncbi:MAG TPA: glycosyltransferase [Pyrinomonadaceae bacterium]|nr:glycosyltransferase [Pyrinomonadaceae bacterium]
MKLQRITTNYPGYLRQFYQTRTELASQSYAAQHAALMSDAHGWADFWSAALGKLGYECDEVVSNAEPLQKAWARENGFSYNEDNWLFEITTAQVKSFRPDALFVNDYVTYPADFIRQLKAECSSIRLVLGWCGAPYTDGSVFAAYDVILSSVPELVEGFRGQGHRCEHVNHAFDPRVLARLEQNEPNVDFGFIGTIAKKNKFHNSRETLLLELLERTPLQIWVDSHSPSWQERSNVLIRQWAFDVVQMASRAGVSGTTLEAIPIAGKVRNWKGRPALSPKLDPRILAVAQRPLFGLEMFQQLQRTRVSLNTHIDISATYASNMRLYEATGAGSCLLTDWKSNLGELFEPDVEVVTYKSADECVEKFNYLASHEDERRAIAAAGQRRTLRDHTFDNRAVQLDQLIQTACRL